MNRKLKTRRTLLIAWLAFIVFLAGWIGAHSGWIRFRHRMPLPETIAQSYEVKANYPHIVPTKLNVILTINKTTLSLSPDGVLLFPITVTNRSAYTLRATAKPAQFSGGLYLLPPIMACATDARFVRFGYEPQVFGHPPLLPPNVYAPSGFSIPHDQFKNFGLGLVSKTTTTNYTTGILDQRTGTYDIQVVYLFNVDGQDQYVTSPLTRIWVSAP